MKHCLPDLSGLRRYPVGERSSIFSLPHAARLYEKGDSFRDFTRKLPDVLGARDLHSVAGAVADAVRARKPVILGMGAHPIKLGLSPVIADLAERGIVTAIAMNGACIVHDFEVAFTGRTSEDVGKELADGSFGMALETGTLVNRAINDGVKAGYGIGEAVGRFIGSSDFPHRDRSLLAAAVTKGIPVTVHVAVGADIVHMHPEADGAMIGEGSLRDFRIFTSVVTGLEGGVYINLGSSVILPEVFLKALSVARNLGHTVNRITTINMDFIQHYRPRENVLKRPCSSGGRSFALTGHHEIMLPLLTAMILEELP